MNTQATNYHQNQPWKLRLFFKIIIYFFSFFIQVEGDSSGGSIINSVNDCASASTSNSDSNKKGSSTSPTQQFVNDSASSSSTIVPQNVNTSGAFSWNGLSKPSEIRKVYSANNTWPLWIYYTRYTHRPQLAAQHAANQLANQPPNRFLNSNHRPPTMHHHHHQNKIKQQQHHQQSGHSHQQAAKNESTSSASPPSSRRVRLAFTAEQLKRLKVRLDFYCLLWKKTINFALFL